MKSRLMITACVAVLAAFSFVRAEEKPAEPKSDAKPTVRLMSPYSKLSSLSDEQKAKLREIRAKGAEDIRKIQEQMKTDMLAVLTDEQKEEAKKIEAEALAKRKPAEKPADAPAPKE